MADDPLGDLADLLQVQPEDLSPLAGCAPTDVAALADAVAAMLSAEDERIDAGLHQALRAVPLPLRGQARTLLLGDGS